MSISTEDAMSAALSAAKAAAAALDGKPVEAVEHALDAALALVPTGDLAPYLTEAGVRRAKLAKRLADAAKFGAPVDLG